MTDPGVRTSLSNGANDEDAELLWQATGRADALLDDLAAGRPPAAELSALLGYLREVVLTRIAEEERQVFPALRQVDPSHPDVDRLCQDHVLVRADVDDLAAAAAAHDPRDTDQLAAVTRRLISRLEGHLRNEATALAKLPGGYHASASGWARAQHWYSLTEGPLIDMDQLRPDQAEDAVLNRLTHLRADEHVELHGHSDPQRLWRRLRGRAPDGYSWSERREDPNGWIVSVTRRRVE